MLKRRLQLITGILFSFTIIIALFFGAKFVFAEGYIYSHKWGSTGSGATQFSNPRKIAIGPNGNVYIADYTNNRIQVFTQAGTAVTRWGTSGSGTANMRNPHGIAVSSTTGNVYVTEFTNNRVHVFTATGVHVAMWGSAGSGTGQFDHALGIALDSSENVYVADSSNDRIQKFDSSGVHLATYGTSGSANGQLNHPTGIAIDSSGNMYISEEGNHRIQKWDSSGNYLATIGSVGSAQGQLAAPQDVFLDHLGNIYTTNYGNTRIEKYDSNGNYVTFFGSLGSGNGQFSSIWGGVVSTTTGNIFVPDSFYNRVQAFSGVGDPQVTTDPADTVTAESVNLNGTIDNIQSMLLTSRGFEYGTTTNYGATTTETGSFDVGAFALPLTSLICETTYHYRAYVAHNYDIGRGADATFTTDTCLPATVTTTSVTGSVSGFVADGSIDVSGGSFSTQWGFQYGTTLAYGATTTTTGNLYTGTFQQSVTGLSNATTYNVRAYSINSAGVSYGSNMTVTTFNPSYNASYVLGQSSFSTSTYNLTSSGLYSVRGTALDKAHNRLFVSTGDHRVLVFDTSSGISNNMSAVNVLGQADLVSNTSGAGAGGLNEPFGLDYDEDNNRLFVADGFNNRILVYDLTSGITNGMDASFVIGQPDFITTSLATTQSGLWFPVNVYFDQTTDRLYVSDYNNSRMIVFDLSSGITNGMNASYVLGQTDFVTAVAGAGADKFSLNPSIAIDNDRNLLFLVDQYQNRVMVYDISAGIADGMSASYVIGQADFSDLTARTTANGLSQPGAVTYDHNTKWLFVTDQLNRRVLIFDLTNGVVDGMSATYLLGQPDFTSSISQVSQSTYSGITPMKVEYDSSVKRLYLSDVNDNRVLIYDFVKILPHTFSSGTVGVAYTDTATTQNSQGTLAWSVSSGSLPTGLSINALTGSITGTPTTAGTYNFILTVADTVGILQAFTDSASYSIVINPAAVVDSGNSNNSTSTAVVLDGSTSGGRSRVSVIAPLLAPVLTVETNRAETEIETKAIKNHDVEVDEKKDVMDTEVRSTETETTGESRSEIGGSSNSSSGSRIQVLNQSLAKLANTTIPSVVKVVGVVSGASLLIFGSIVNVFTGSDVGSMALRFSGLLSSALGLRRRYKPWGTVYDSVTKQPIDPAIVTLYDLSGAEVSSSITDQDGRYGFLVPPGTYRIEAQKSNFTFPSMKLSGKLYDELYDNLYFGELITVASSDDVISKNIPLDQNGFDWNEFEKNKEKATVFFSRWDVWIQRFFITSFVCGFIVTIVSIFYVPSPYNYFTIGLYIVISLLRIFGIKTKTFGKVKDSNGKPLSYGVVKVYFAGTRDLLLKKVIDQYGRYSALVSPGDYEITIERKNADQSYTEVYSSGVINAKKGIINSDITV